MFIGMAIVLTGRCGGQLAPAGFSFVTLVNPTTGTRETVYLNNPSTGLSEPVILRTSA